MQRIIVMGFLCVLLAGGAGAFWLLNTPPVEPVAVEPPSVTEAATELPTATTAAAQRSDAVIVDARVVPRRSADLTFSINNVPVTEILVQEGAVVDENTPLMRLDPRELQLRVEQAEAALQRAEADYERLVEGPTPAQIAQARAQLSQAQARLRQSLGMVTAEDIEAAEARLEEARSRLAELEAGPKPEEIEVARAALDRARSTLEQQRSRLSSAKTTARSRVEQAANELRDAQDAYSQIYWTVRDREDQVDGLELQDLRNQEQAALRAVQTAEEGLEQARVAYEEALQSEASGLQVAETAVRDAQARLNLLLAGADVDEVATARAAVADAAARLVSLQGEARAGAVEAARADVADAQARLDDLLAGPLESDLARAEAAIKELEVRLRQQQLEAERATMLAPIAGVIAEVNVDLGEVPNGSAPPIVLADVTEWQLETDNLTDLSIVRIREGDPVVATFYALPDLELPGTVHQIKPLSQSADGETIYTVTINFEEHDERLRWNMISQVAIMPAN